MKNSTRKINESTVNKSLMDLSDINLIFQCTRKLFLFGISYINQVGHRP
jgi:hypothetical protein